MQEYTLLLIKPNATRKHRVGAILAIIEEACFKIEEMRLLVMNDDLASRFYAVHKDKHFYNRLVKFMTSGRTIAVLLRREYAVSHLRSMVGATNPGQAAPGTIRHIYGESVTMNAVHASDSPENAIFETCLLFPHLKGKIKNPINMEEA
ncbi:MAG: nucleoside-diphosphate kinase [Candidatus Cloacimonetes bacterium]|nr:nucleoside-diphosphate kinase [Candidatus Cloacimonadota bacterium]